MDARSGEMMKWDPQIDGKSKPEEPVKSAGGGGGGVSEALASREGKIVGISRGDMRRIFMAGCEPFVRWSHHVVGYESTSEGVRVVFADGSKSEEGSLLVGGEGIYSKVAKQLSGGKIKIFDTGARGEKHTVHIGEGD